MKDILSLAVIIAACSCSNNSIILKEVAKDTIARQSVSVVIKVSAADICSKPQVPILCYHHIRPLKKNSTNDYVVTPSSFGEQMKALADSGYHTVLPADLERYYTLNKVLPPKPIMLTFDDTDLEQFTIAEAEMKKYGYKGVFFIMNISIGKRNYMSAENLKTLAAEGNIVGAHTWDHRRVTDYNDSAWNKQL
ncbi:MAG: polysaccharide deacetylase family protein, partial [Ginsengibacter sp.]